MSTRTGLLTIFSRLTCCDHDDSCLRCCWIWQGSIDKWGYGKVRYKGKATTPHRVVYMEIHKTLLTNTQYILHTCNNRLCCNIRHLYLGDHMQNMKDMRDRKRAISGENHHQAKMTLTQVQEVRKLYASGQYTIVELCKHYPISYSQMQRIVKGEKWYD